jgi:hypothetical protein
VKYNNRINRPDLLCYFLQELKLNSLLVEEVEQLVVLLHQLAVDLRCSQYTDYYCRDFPKLLDIINSTSQVKDGETSLCTQLYTYNLNILYIM